jgi:CRP-like cAMP-binding protein
MPLIGRLAVVIDGHPATVIGPGEGAGFSTAPEAPAHLTLVALEEVTLLVAERRTLLAASDTNPRIASVVARSLGRPARTR